MRRLTWLAAQYSFTVHAEHLPGKLNNIADAISRFQIKRFQSSAPQADQSPTPCPQFKDLTIF